MSLSIASLSSRNGLFVYFVLFLTVMNSFLVPHVFGDDVVRSKNQYSRFDNDGDESIVSVFERYGILKILQNLVPEVVDLLKQAESLFDLVNKERHFHDMNKILGHFKNAWVMVLDYFNKEDPTKAINSTKFRELLNVYQNKIDFLISSDRELAESDVKIFLVQLHHVFDVIYSSYETIDQLNSPIKLYWPMVFFTRQYVSALPTDLFDPSMFRDILDAPRQLRKVFSSSLDELFRGEQGPYVSMILNFLQTMTEKQRYNENKQEL